MRNNKVNAIQFFIRFVALATAVLCLAFAATAQIRTIETTVATLHLSEDTGDLVGLHWKDPNLEVIGEPRLGENFRLLIPNIEYEANYVPFLAEPFCVYYAGGMQGDSCAELTAATCSRQSGVDQGPGSCFRSRFLAATTPIPPPRTGDQNHGETRGPSE